MKLSNLSHENSYNLYYSNHKINLDELPLQKYISFQCLSIIRHNTTTKVYSATSHIFYQLLNTELINTTQRSPNSFRNI